MKVELIKPPIFLDLTIGIPVFNEELFVRTAIESALGQGARIIIVDNASTDSSSSICAAIASGFHDIQFIRNKHNIGGMGSFAACLKAASTEYFMWLGAHDFISKDCCEVLYNKMVENDDVVLCYGNTALVNEDGEVIGKYDFRAPKGAAEEPHVRMLAAIDQIDCVAIYGLHRTQAIRKALWRTPIYGPDKITLARLAMQGKIIHVGRDEPVSYQRVIRRSNTIKDYMVRVSGKEVKSGPDEMCHELFRLALSINGVPILRRMRFLQRIIKSLRSYGWSPLKYALRKQRISNA